MSSFLDLIPLTSELNSSSLHVIMSLISVSLDLIELVLLVIQFSDATDSLGSDFLI